MVDVDGGFEFAEEDGLVSAVHLPRLAVPSDAYDLNGLGGVDVEVIGILPPLSSQRDAGSIGRGIDFVGIAGFGRLERAGPFEDPDRIALPDRFASPGD